MDEKPKEGLGQLKVHGGTITLISRMSNRGQRLHPNGLWIVSTTTRRVPGTVRNDYPTSYG